MGRPHSYLVPWESLQSHSNKPECTSGSAAAQGGGVSATFQEEAKSPGFGGAKERSLPLGGGRGLCQGPEQDGALGA